MILLNFLLQRCCSILWTPLNLNPNSSNSAFKSINQLLYNSLKLITLPINFNSTSFQFTEIDHSFDQFHFQVIDFVLGFRFNSRLRQSTIACFFYNQIGKIRVTIVVYADETPRNGKIGKVNSR